jgi:pimeloyl-ACP methyl ester carboxylesterase
MTELTQYMTLTQYVEAGGIRFAYRRLGVPERFPLVFFQHFMGTLDDDDPALTDAFAADREVILFNNAGVASSTGTVPGTIEAMARDAITFIDALGPTTIDIVGHSMGGLVAQEVALARPDLVRRLVLVGTGPRGGEGIGALPAWVAELFTRRYQPGASPSSWSTAATTSSSRRSTPTSCSSSFPMPSSSSTRTLTTARTSSTRNCSSATRASSSTISPPRTARTSPAKEHGGTH